MMTTPNKAKQDYLILVQKKFDELKALILSEQFLSGFSYDKTISTHVITDLTKALDILMDDDWLYPDHTAMTYLLPEHDYSNFLCYDAALDPITIDWSEIDAVWENIHLEFWDFIVKALQTPKFDWLEKTGNLMYVAEAIQTDLYNILSFISSADSQKESKFLEQQLKVYQNGGFPCGWFGKYPDGEIIVYSPK
jgi:hypothetical protein